MAYQRGSLKKLRRKEGESWVLRFRVTNAEGKRVEHVATVGLVGKFPKDRDAWREVDRLGLGIRINDSPAPGRVQFDFLAEHYLKADFGEDAVRPKTERTTLNTRQIVRSYLIPRWGEEIAEDIKPVELQRWFQSLHNDEGLAWTTVSKFRGTMLRIYKTGLLHELVGKNPVAPVETRSITDYKAILVTPKQTLEIIQSLSNPLHRILVLTCAATALRASELLSLRWSDLLWEEAKISVTKRWSLGKDGPTKTRKSEGHVPLHPVLASQLKEWRSRTAHPADTDFVFPSYKKEGRVPLSPPCLLPTICGRRQLRQE